MTDAVQIALIVAVPTVITAVGGILATVVTDRRAGKKLDHITVLTNSTLTLANKRIADLEAAISGLIEQMHSRDPRTSVTAEAQQVLDNKNK